MIRVNDLKDYTYCPVIPWIRKKLGWREPITFSQKVGKKLDVRALTSFIPDPKFYEVFLKDKSTGLVGIADVIGKDVVAEVKAFPKKRLVYHFRTQLLAYAYLAERNGYRVRNAVLVTGDRERLNIEVRKEHLEYVEKLAKRLADFLDDDSPPVANPSLGQCKACQYRRVCPVSVIL